MIQNIHIKKILVVLFVLFSSRVFAFDHSHQRFDGILKKYVQMDGAQGLVDYKALKKDISSLDQYLSELSNITETQFQKFSKNEQLAFLINAYNAFTFKLIIDHYPVKSIKSIFFISSPWKEEFFLLFGKKTHLDYVEHGLIRKKFKEPRIHFAVVCASMGCPTIQKFAYRAEELDSQLNKAARMFINDGKKNQILPDKLEMNISKIFKWYERDFASNHKNIKHYILQYAEISPKDREKLKGEM